MSHDILNITINYFFTKWPVLPELCTKSATCGPVKYGRRVQYPNFNHVIVSSIIMVELLSFIYLFENDLTLTLCLAHCAHRVIF